MIKVVFFLFPYPLCRVLRVRLRFTIYSKNHMSFGKNPRKRDMTNLQMMQCTKRGSSGVTSYPGTRCLSTSWGTSLLTCQVFSRSLSFESFSAFLTSLISHLQPIVFCFIRPACDRCPVSFLGNQRVASKDLRFSPWEQVQQSTFPYQPNSHYPCLLLPFAELWALLANHDVRMLATPL